jgi:hypothetical protein
VLHDRLRGVLDPDVAGFGTSAGFGATWKYDTLQISASSHAMSESESRLLACQIRHASLSASALVAVPEPLDVQPLGGGVADQAHVVRPGHPKDAAELVAGLGGQPRQRVVAE